jgi:uncharacterized protein YebE (UPF0316 family)
MVVTALLVFFFITTVNIFFTVRLMLITRGRRVVGAVLGFWEALIFAYSFGQVLTDVQALPLLFSYCMGSVIGTWLGMGIERQFVLGFVRVKIIVPTNGEKIAHALRESGYGVTRSLGYGGQGQVSILHSVVNKKDVRALIDCVESINPKAFITTEEQVFYRGWLRSLAN